MDATAVKNFQVVQMTQQYQTYLKKEKLCYLCNKICSLSLKKCGLSLERHLV